MEPGKEGNIAANSTRLSAAGRTWRVTTATRVFTVAMGFGLAASDGKLSDVWATFAAVCAVMAFMAAVESDPTVGPVLPIAEGALVAVILSMTDAPTEPILVCLVVPPLVAALRYGAVASSATVLVELIATFAVTEGRTASGVSLATLEPVLTWLAAGLGIGFLAAWMRSSHRTLERAQAPYEAAHHLLSQLHAVSRTLPVGLDARSIAATITGRAGMSLPTARSVVLLGRSSLDTLVPLAQTGSTVRRGSLADDALVQQCRATASVQWSAPTDPPRVCLPLRVGTQMVGVLAVDLDRSLEESALAHVQPFLDEQSLRLDTALLFDEVRALATAEERNRLAREIHDGIAQEVASLGYLVDDLAATTESAKTKEVTSFLRHELTRVVSELRLSIFDLRHHVDEHVGLGASLTDYANEVGAGAGLSVHLDITEDPDGLPTDIQNELLRIAQEAITNVRKHARGSNLWIHLHTVANARLCIEDDGVGATDHRPGHYGLHSIRERAERIGATATITERVGGGTVVDVQLASPHPPTQGADDVDHRVAR